VILPRFEFSCELPVLDVALSHKAWPLQGIYLLQRKRGIHVAVRKKVEMIASDRWPA
jgi:hypothetical protein